MKFGTVLVLFLMLGSDVRQTQATIAPRTEDLVSRSAIIVVGRLISAEVIDRNEIRSTIAPIKFYKGSPRKIPLRLKIRTGYYTHAEVPWSEELRLRLQQDADHNLGKTFVFFLNAIVDDAGNMRLFPVDPWFGAQVDSQELRRGIISALSRTARENSQPFNWRIVLPSLGIAAACGYAVGRYFCTPGGIEGNPGR